MKRNTTNAKSKIKFNNPLSVLSHTAGRFTSVTYTNMGNITKNYTVRTGVKKYLRGGTKTEVPESITVFCVDTGKQGYKTFKKNGIKKIRCGKLKFSK